MDLAPPHAADAELIGRPEPRPRDPRGAAEAAIDRATDALLDLSLIRLTRPGDTVETAALLHEALLGTRKALDEAIGHLAKRRGLA